MADSQMTSDTLTAMQRALHYVQWHQEAYGAPAPQQEILSQLQMRHGLATKAAEDLLKAMAASGHIAKHGAGWVIAHQCVAGKGESV